ncbi:MAG: nucleotidyltransferase family protein [Acetobacteraceae bacterium]|nr:nucleotidyltransferase family protein [Acetobacteraceae bacterium]
MRLEQIVRSDPDLMRLLDCLRGLTLPQWRLVSGCLYQTVWNVLTHRPRGTGIQDHDVIYFDDDDLSWDAEDAVIRRAEAVAVGCVGPLQIRNQARVHLWYEQHFGHPYAPLRTADEALLTYPATAQAIGVRLEANDRLDIVAPLGLDDVFAMTMRPNPGLAVGPVFDAKAARALSVWPEVTIVYGPEP